jgi:hypothetical protein
MARYLIKQSCYVGATYYAASFSAPQAITLPDTTPPSRTWEPLDDAALKALKDLDANSIEQAKEALELLEGKEAASLARDIAAMKAASARRSVVGVPAPKPEAKEVNTMSEIAAKRGANVVGRVSDKSPV